MTKIDPSNLGEPNRGTYYDSLTTTRIYELTKGELLGVSHQYQRILCPHCKEFMWVRHTYIEWPIALPRVPSLLHRNYRKTYQELLPIAIQDTGDGPIYEVQINGEWKLQLNDNIVGNLLWTNSD